MNMNIARLDARLCRNANLTLPEARLLETVLSHPNKAELVKLFGHELIGRLERRGYIGFDGERYSLTAAGFYALERCFK